MPQTHFYSPHPYYFSWQKKIFDICCSTLFFIIAAPLLCVIYISIFLTMGSPVLFTQARFGKQKQPFTMYKFRTMHKYAELVRGRLAHKNEAPAPMFKMEHDPRFVGIGQWLSQTGLDELPQLVNVIQGKMSLIGPRPLPIAEANKLDSQWDFRYTVLPGIFSEWAADESKHHSLERWRNIEKNMLKNGSLQGDITIMILIFKKITLKMIRITLPQKRFNHLGR